MSEGMREILSQQNDCTMIQTALNTLHSGPHGVNKQSIHFLYPHLYACLFIKHFA